MATFAEFLNSFDPDSKGKEFEGFVKWFLKNDLEWSTQVDQVWLWDDYPDRWGRDLGVDLVFKHKNGEIWAVQAKCYSQKYYIKLEDIKGFLADSNRPIVNKRLLIASTDLIGANAMNVIDGQEKPVTHFLFSDFDKSTIDYPSNLSKLKTAKRKKRPKPYPHQKEAIKAVAKGFKGSTRGQLIMACGTGKTFISLWVKERLSAESTLVLVPSLGLLSQTLREWTFACNTPFDVLCVCSDQTVGKKEKGKKANKDEMFQSVKDLHFPVTSDKQEISTFLEGKGHKVIFSTYQSSPLIAESQRNPKVPMFDLAIADEAHRCAGKVGSEFTTALDDKKIRASKRLFATATPRTYSASLKRGASERGVTVTGMDDDEVFGKIFHTLTFGKAIEDGLLTDYQVVIIGVDDPLIAEWIEKRKLVQTESGDETDAESHASQIGLIKAIKDYDLKRMISFHSRVKRAETFASEIQSSMDFVNSKNKEKDSIWTGYVSGKMSAHDRRIKLDQLKELSQGDRGLLANARCLSEGVDVPSLDGIAFIDPRSSQVDIVQAVGRAIRLSGDKKIGTIILPVFIKDGESAEASIEASNFKPVWSVLNALKSHDEVLSFELDQLRTELGKRKGLSKGRFRKIIMDIPETVDQSFADSLKTYLVEKTTSSWNFWFGLLEVYVDRKGHSLVPNKFETEDNYRLGEWVIEQRKLKRKDGLTQERINRLETLEKDGLSVWSWDPRGEDAWEQGFLLLVDYVGEYGHARVPDTHTIKDKDDFGLGTWVLRQRRDRDKLAPEQLKKLKGLKNLEGKKVWSWDPLIEQWEKAFLLLEQFVKDEGHTIVSSRSKKIDGVSLGTWVCSQRNLISKIEKDEETLERINRLEALENSEGLKAWSWDPRKDAWEQGFSYLLQYVEDEGHARVPGKFKIKWVPGKFKVKKDKYPLGRWVDTQRQNKKRKNKDLTPERIKRLGELEGWVWNARK
jgi:superfamily II DNA or RNA helicase